MLRVTTSNNRDTGVLACDILHTFLYLIYPFVLDVHYGNYVCPQMYVKKVEHAHVCLKKIYGLK